MLIPIILAILAAIFYAATYHIDEYLISKAVKNANYRALILVSTIIAGGMMTVIYMFVCNFDFSFDILSFLLLIFNAVVYVLALIIYYKALNRDDPTIVAIMFQFLPVFILFLSPLILDNQQISLLKLIGGVIITIAAILLIYEPKHKKIDKKRLVTLIMMVFVSLGYAIWYIVERYINQNHDFNQTILWTNISLIIVGIFIFTFMKSFRKSFFEMFKRNGLVVVGLNIANEILYSFAGVFSTLAGTLIPVALVFFISQGIEPFVVMLMGFLIVKVFPKTKKEKITKADIIKRIITIIVCIIGLGFIEFG